MRVRGKRRGGVGAWARSSEQRAGRRSQAGVEWAERDVQGRWDKQGKGDEVKQGVQGEG